MRKLFCIVAFTLILGAAWGASPFAVTASLERVDGAFEVVVIADMPAEHYLYADSFAVSASTGTLSRLQPLPSKRKLDPFSGEERDVLAHGFTARFRLADWNGQAPLQVVITYQGCSGEICFLPATRRFLFASDGSGAPPPAAASPAAVAVGSPDAWTNGLKVAGLASGYMDARAFLGTLDLIEGRGAPLGTRAAFLADPVAFLRARGLWLTLLLVLLGGLLLNLTPCVLPMIPINLAIIGAGAQAGSRRRGFLLGGTYGAGMALVYGLLGLIVVRTGAVFGALQSSPYFNLAVALLFVLLALALFDILMIDLTRFQRNGAGRGGYWAALSLGGVAALLAGACVAPVVMAVLLMALNLHAAGAPIALALPFLLGVGMALPWPFAGAGLTFLPKPGRWMVWVKYGFGAGMLLLALHYGRLAWKGMGSDAAPVAEAAAWPARVAEARATGKPLLVDFHASWCKSCQAMERTTLRDPAVVRRLEDYVVVRLAAEKPDEPTTRAMLQAFGVGGLPAFVVLRPE